VAAALLTIILPGGAETLTPQETKAVAEEAYVYGFPMVMNYGVMNEYFIDKSSGQYKCGFNELYNTAHVYTPLSSVPIFGPSQS
jgi:hypothetical protein